MSDIAWIVLSVIGGCILFASMLYMMGASKVLIASIILDEKPEDEFEAQIQAETNRRLLKGVIAFVIIAPTCFLIIQEWTGIGVIWSSTLLFFLPVIHWWARRDVEKKYGIDTRSNQQV